VASLLKLGVMSLGDPPRKGRTSYPRSSAVMSKILTGVFSACETFPAILSKRRRKRCFIVFQSIGSTRITFDSLKGQFVFHLFFRWCGGLWWIWIAG